MYRSVTGDTGASRWDCCGLGAEPPQSPPLPIDVGRRFPTPSGRRTAVAGTSAFRLMSGYGTEQPVCLAVDPVGEVQDIGAAVVALDPEGEGPEAASRVAAGVDRDRPLQLSL